jgi:signal transduction histidine kinase
LKNDECNSSERRSPTLSSDDSRIFVIKSLPEAPDDLFQTGEDEEFLFQDYAAAIDRFRALAAESDRAIQAGALLHLARNQKKLGQSAAALDVYKKLSELEGVAVIGLPADLVGRAARCSLLETLGRSASLRREAAQLQSDLQSGRWLLRSGPYLYYIEETNRWLDQKNFESSNSEAAVVAKQLDQLSEKSDSSGHEILRSGSEAGAFLWSRSSEGLVALAAGPKYVKTKWRSSIDSLLASQGLQLLLEDPSPETPPDTFETVRNAKESGLPWNLIVRNADGEANSAHAVSRRRLVLAGLTMLIMMVLVVSYFMGRAVTRELQLARLQSDFVSAVSHEFRTPLTSLGQATEILSDGRVTDPDQQRKFYGAQARATGRLRRLVESLLEFGRMEAGRKPYRMETLDAEDLVRSVVEDFQNESENTTCAIEVSSNGSALFEGDREALGRALRNLLDNAVKYSPDCQRVWVEVRRSEEKIAISVKDSGIGIPHSERTQIFRKFVRGADAKRYGIKGTGVGLAMVDHIIRGHGAEIRVESEPGKGSIFTILMRGKNGKHSCY